MTATTIDAMIFRGLIVRNFQYFIGYVRCGWNQ